MGKKRVIEQNIRKHTKELEESIALITPGLIEAFTKVYGEKHRAKITSTILNMNYIFFIPEKSCKILNLYKTGIRKKYKQIMLSYINYLRNKDYTFNTVSHKDEVKYIIKNYLSRYPFKVENYIIFASALATDCPCCSAALYETATNAISEFYICLPIFTIDLKTIIHELNHALNISIIGYTDEVLLMRTLFNKESNEELVNDFIAELVFETYLEIGGVIPKSLKRFKIGNEYEYKDYIVAHLFECLVDLITESRISENFNLFYELVGKEKTEELENIMAELYEKDYFDEKLYNELISLIDEIYEKVINSNPINSEEQIKYFENQGLKLRLLKKKEK